MKYFDTTYLVRLYFKDSGWNAVRTLATGDKIACSLLGKAEIIAAFHRKFREGQITNKDLTILIEEFEADAKSGAIVWLPLSERVLSRLMNSYKGVPASTALRGADAIHLGTAAEANLREVYSNDRRLLMAAENFGIKGVNVI